MGAILKTAHITDIVDGLILLANPSVDGNEKTYVSSDANAAQNKVNVLNATNLTANDFILIGQYGNGKAEIKKISSISSNELTLTTNLSFNHSPDEPVYLIGCDQIKIYSDTVSTGTFTTLVATVTIDPTELYTSYYLSSVAAYYKIKHYNSHTSGLGSFSSACPGTGYVDYTLKKLQDRVIELFGDTKEEFLTRTQITRWLNEGYEAVQTAITEIDSDYFLTYSGNLSLTSGTAEYELPSNFRQLKRITVSYGGSNYYRARKQSIQDEDPDSLYTDTTKPFYYLIYNSIGFRPTPTSSSGVYRLWYYPATLTLSSDSDTLDASCRYHSSCLVDYALYRAKLADDKVEEANNYLAIFNNGLTRILREVDQRNKDESDYVQITDSNFIAVCDDDS